MQQAKIYAWSLGLGRRIKKETLALSENVIVHRILAGYDLLLPYLVPELEDPWKYSACPMQKGYLLLLA